MKSVTDSASDRDPPDGLRSVLDRLEVAPEDRSLIALLMSELEAAEPESRRETVDRAKVVLRGHVDALMALGQGLYEQSFPDCELLSAHVFLEILRSDPGAPDAIAGITQALRHISELEDAESIVAEVLRLAPRDPRVLHAWIEWLAVHGHEDRRRIVAQDALTRSLGQLEVTPDDPSVIASVVLALEDADAEARSDAVDRAAATLSGHVAALVRFGDGLWRQSFPDCELMGARLLLEALRSDPQAPGAVEGIASATAYIASTEDARPVVEEALRLSGDDSALLSEWTRRLDRAHKPTTAVPVLPQGSQYGRCRCTSTFEQREVEIRMLVQEESVVLNDVPQGVCPSCGTKVYKANVLAALEALLKGSVAPPRK